VVSEDYNGGIAEIKAQVEAGNVTWDVVDVELSDAVSVHVTKASPKKSIRQFFLLLQMAHQPCQTLLMVL
jgi:hypothetical protein